MITRKRREKEELNPRKTSDAQYCCLPHNDQCSACSWAAVCGTWQIPLSSYREHDMPRRGMSPWPLWISCPILAHPQLLEELHWQIMTLKSPWLWVSNTEQHQRHQCVVKIILILYLKHSIAPASEKKTNSIPAATRTSGQVRGENRIFSRWPSSLMLLNLHSILPMYLSTQAGSGLSCNCKEMFNCRRNILGKMSRN